MSLRFIIFKSLSKQLTSDFGKGFDASNLRNIRQSYIVFSNCDAVRHNLSWTHYRHLMRLENEHALAMKEKQQNRNYN
ncbi:MAG: DUF1016 N-terminal domain-containing protein [Bacteroidota bacterium]